MGSKASESSDMVRFQSSEKQRQLIGLLDHPVFDPTNTYKHQQTTVVSFSGGRNTSVWSACLMIITRLVYFAAKCHIPWKTFEQNKSDSLAISGSSPIHRNLQKQSSGFHHRSNGKILHQWWGTGLWSLRLWSSSSWNEHRDGWSIGVWKTNKAIYIYI